jgi:hypothetical protein
VKIFVDRQNCNCWEGACESCFGWRILQLMEKGELHPSSCHIRTEDDGELAYTFHIHDRDGKDKELVVNKENWTEAYEAWPELLAKQSKKTEV